MVDVQAEWAPKRPTPIQQPGWPCQDFQTHIEWYHRPFGQLVLSISILRLVVGRALEGLPLIPTTALTLAQEERKPTEWSPTVENGSEAQRMTALETQLQHILVIW